MEKMKFNLFPPNCLFCFIFLFLSRESDGGVNFGRIRTRLGVADFPSFFGCFYDFLPIILLLDQSYQAEILLSSAFYQRTQQRDEDGNRT